MAGFVQRASRHLMANQRAALSAAVAGVGLAGVAVNQGWGKASSLQDVSEVSVMTWNVLARPYTKFNQKFHRNNDKVEDQSQTQSRYTLAGEQIVGLSSDLVLLQECEAAFFEPEWNLAAARILERYYLFACRHGSEGGTAVLVKKQGRVAAQAKQPICIGGSSETGGHSKVATVVPVRVGSKDINVISTHFTWDGAAPQRLHHAKLVGDHLKSSSFILGGDFNCQPGPSLDELESSSFFGDADRAPLPSDTMTGLSGDFSKQEQIDHIYTSKDLSVHSGAALGKPGSPWGGKITRPAKVSAASDHVPVLAVVGVA